METKERKNYGRIRKIEEKNEKGRKRNIKNITL